LLGSGTRYLFSSFPTKSSTVFYFFFEAYNFLPFSLSFQLVLCNYVLDWLVGGFNCLFSFP
jgi:glycopeptide antibiotics resistance protein